MLKKIIYISTVHDEHFFNSLIETKYTIVNELDIRKSVKSILKNDHNALNYLVSNEVDVHIWPFLKYKKFKTCIFITLMDLAKSVEMLLNINEKNNIGAEIEFRCICNDSEEIIPDGIFGSVISYK